LLSAKAEKPSARVASVKFSIKLGTQRITPVAQLVE
jgi:hypothetical protein